MEIGVRGRVALAAAALLLFAAGPRFADAESLRGNLPAPGSGRGKPIRLSLKICGAKKKKREVSFYKSVARQAIVRSTGAPGPSSER